MLVIENHRAAALDFCSAVRLQPRFVSVLSRVLLLVTLIISMSSCSNTPTAYDDSAEGRVLSKQLCNSVLSFVRAPLDSNGLRRAWFLPFGSYADGSFDFYAPMASSPSDDHSTSFYENRVGQLTHYLYAPDFAESLSECLSKVNKFVQVHVKRQEDYWRSSHKDLSTKRRIEIIAAENTTGILIAASNWRGSIERALDREASLTGGSESE